MYRQNSKTQQGFSMIEVLVTVLIMAVGLLGIAGIQILNVKTVNNTQYRTLATMYAYDMAERMRSNKENVIGGHYNDLDRDTSTSASCLSGACSADNLAAADAYEWNNAIRAYADNDRSANDLPNGSGVVAYVETETSCSLNVTYQVFDITIAWQEQQRGSASTNVVDETFTHRIRIEGDPDAVCS